jgi:hypothetical protein
MISDSSATYAEMTSIRHRLIDCQQMLKETMEPEFDQRCALRWI